MAGKTTQVKGRIELQTDSKGLRASINFSRDEAESTWGYEELESLLKENGIVEGYDVASLKKVIDTLDTVKDNMISADIAKGVEPEKPVPETPEWKDLEIPEKFRSDIEAAISTAEPAIITLEKIEKVTEEKEVTVKPKLPFMQAKTEKVKVTEKKTKKERVYIDPTVEKFAFVQEGQQLAFMEPSTTGVPGRSIYGKAITPAPLADPNFYTGDNIENKKTELIAGATGILRIGNNWADILPFRFHEWEVSLSNDKNTCLLKFIPGSKAATAPTGEEILAKAKELEYPEEHLAEAEDIEEYITNAIASGEILSACPISKSDDAEYRVDITEDKLKATLYLRKGRGNGKALSLKEVGAAIMAAKLKGLDLKKIQTDVKEFYNGPETELKSYILAEGKPATKGQEREMESSARYVNDAEMEILKKAVQDNPVGSELLESVEAFPIDAVQKMAFVEAEQRIFTVTPATKGEPGQDIFGNQIPGADGEKPPLELFENIDEKQNVLISTIGGVLDEAVIDGVTKLRVRPHKNGEVQVTISEDQMEAFLTLLAAEGTGQKLSVEMVDEEIKKSGVQKGINREVIEEAIKRTNEEGSLTNILFAEGKHPRAGSENQLKFLINRAAGNKVAIDEKGQADYKNRDDITSVAKGVAVAEILPPSVTPEPGWNVFGKELNPQEAKPLNITIGKNIEEQKQEDGKTILIATESGQLKWDKKIISIETGHAIKGDVDMKTGNVKFSGTVTITGTVRSGFVVFSGEDIKIGEGAEAALLSADGSVMMKQGIKGAKKGVIRTKQDIVAGFAEQARLLAVQDIRLKAACLRCVVKANGKLYLDTSKGKIIGGRIKVRKGIETADLGSERGIRTEVSFGQDYLIEDQIEIEDREIKKLKDRIAMADMAMQRAKKEGNQIHLKKLHTEKFKFLKIMEKRSLRLFTLRERFEQHYPSDLLVKGTLYPGVIIESHGRFHEVTRPQKNVNITFDLKTGRIEINPITKEQ